jgi:hypothetical protein
MEGLGQLGRFIAGPGDHRQNALLMILLNLICSDGLLATLAIFDAHLTAN